jgi:hypothetical protein
MLMLCPICAGEFETQSFACLRCGCELVPSSISDVQSFPDEVTGSTRELEFVELCRPQSNPEAMFIKATLEQNNIAVMIQGIHSSWVMPHLAFGGQLRLLVDREQFEYASAIYKAYFESEEDIDYSPEE